MLPRISPLLRFVLAFAAVALGAAPLKVTVISDDHVAVKSLVEELKGAGAVVTEADRPSEILDVKHGKDEVVVLYRKEYVLTKSRNARPSPTCRTAASASSPFAAPSPDLPPPGLATPSAPAGPRRAAASGRS